MFKKLGSAGVICAALVVSALIMGHAAAAASFSYNDDPVPGGMCGCGSCNCIMVKAVEDMDVAVNPRPLLMSLLSKKQVAAIAEGATLQEENKIKASNNTSSNTQSNAGKTTNTQTSNTQSTANKTTNTQTTSNTVSNTNKTTNTQSSSGPSESLVSSGGSSSSNNKQDSGNKTSNTQTSNSSDGTKDTSGRSTTGSNSSLVSGSDGNKDSSSKTASQSGNTQSTRNDSLIDNSTGKSSGSYNYSSDAGKIRVADNNPDYRSLFLDSSKADLVAPEVKKSSYSPDYFKGDDWRLFQDPYGWTTSPTGPAGVREIRRGNYTLEQATDAARKAKSDDNGVYYEYVKTDTTKGYVNNKGIPVNFVDPTK